MLHITVEFLHGTFRGAGADDTAFTGQGSSAEWPPSPARLFQALVAGAGTGSRCTVPVASAALARLEDAGPPAIRAVPEAALLRTRLLDRFAVIDEAADRSVQNYPARLAQLVRPGERIAPAESTVGYEWDDLELSEPELAELRFRAARVPYLGCADSPVRVRVSTDPAADSRQLARWVPHEDGEGVPLPVPYPGFVDVLDAAFDQWTSGAPRRRAWVPNRILSYRLEDDVAAARPACVWLRFDRPLRSRLVVAIAETLKAAVLERYERLVAGGDRSRVPAVLHGHHPDAGRGYMNAHWLPLPHVGAEHADGRIRGACIWLPPGTTSEIVAGLTVAAGSLHELVKPKVFSVGCELFDGSSRPWSTNPRRWSVPSRQFISAFPVVHERRSRGVASLEEIGRWCTHVGLPEPVAARTASVPLTEGAASLAPFDVFREGRERRPYSHLALTFAEPVAGPFALGRYRSYGLGLMAPVSERGHRG